MMKRRRPRAAEVRSVMTGVTKAMDLMDLIQEGIMFTNVLSAEKMNVLSDDSRQKIRQIQEMLKEADRKLDPVIDEFSFRISSMANVRTPREQNYKTVFVPYENVAYRNKDKILVHLPDHSNTSGYSMWVGRKFYDYSKNGQGYEIRFYNDSVINIYAYKQEDGKYVITDKKSITGRDLDFAFSTHDTYQIYQLNPDLPDAHDVAFVSMSYLEKHGLEIDSKNYEVVYSAPLDADTTLDSLFEQFNINRPSNFYGHSMSVSDVVVMNRNGNEEAYYVDSTGFVKLDGFVEELQDNPEMVKEISQIDEDPIGVE